LASAHFGGAIFMNSSTRWAVALFFLTPAMMAVNYVLGRLAFGLIAPHMLALLRWSIAGVILLAFAWPELTAKRALLRRHALQGLVLGALGMWICGAWVYIGARSTPANNIALLYAMSPAFIALASTLWLHERLSGLQWLGLGLAFTGLVHVIIGGQWGALASLRLNSGDAWILGAVLSWAAYSVLLKRWPSDFSPLARLVLIVFGGVLILLPLAMLEAAVNLPWSLTVWGWQSVGLALVAAVVPGVGSYLGYSTLQKKFGAATAGLTLYLAPLYGAAFAWATLAEPVQWHHAVGAAVILPGIYLASRKPG
jgi:drug/metabolite transporter (DMT)-like permease